jgi:hypothetical protein
MEYILCERCWKEIQKRWPRKYCIQCRNIVDKENSIKYRAEHKEEIKARVMERYRRMRAEMPIDDE